MVMGRPARGSLIFGEKLRKLREDRDLSKNRLATSISKRYGVTMPGSSVGRMERGKQNPSIEQLNAIARYFGVEVGTLVDSTDGGANDSEN